MFTDTNVVRVASADRGMRENPPGTNCTPLTHEYERLVGPISSNGCFAWCCASLIIWWHRAGYIVVPTAAVGQLMSWAKQGKFGLRWSSVPVVGGGNCYGWDGPGTTNWMNMHVGAGMSVRGIWDHDNIEANYQDRVDFWNRNGKYFMGCAVPTFQAAGPPIIQLPPPRLEGLVSLNALAANQKTGEELDFRLVDGHIRYKNSDKNTDWVTIPDGREAGLDWADVGKPITGLTAAGRADGVMVVSVMTDKGFTMRIGQPYQKAGNAPGGVWDRWVSLGKP